jgi:hypothetical protein
MNRSLVISALLLLGSNLIALACAIWFRWNLFEIVLLYWIQALIIGVFQRRKVRDMVAYARHPSRARWFRVDPVTILLASSTFVFAHWWSYRTNKQTDEQRVVNINVLLLPLFRMFLPLHVFFVVMDLDIATAPAVIAVWMSVKATVDLGAHVIEHTESRRVPAA